MKSLSHGPGILFAEIQLNGLLSNKLNAAAAVIAQESTYSPPYLATSLVKFSLFRLEHGRPLEKELNDKLL